MRKAVSFRNGLERDAPATQAKTAFARPAMLGDFMVRPLAVRNPKSFAGDLLAVARVVSTLQNLLC